MFGKSLDVRITDMAEFINAPALVVTDPYFPIQMRLVGTCGIDGELPIYSNTITGLAKKIKKRIDSNNQAVVVITGGTGTGKSTMALQLIRALDKNFRLEDVYIYSAKDLAQKIKDKIPQNINWYDEGSVTLNSLDTTGKAGKSLSKFFDTMRFQGWISIICIPDDMEINKRIMKHLDILIECPESAPIWGFMNKGFFSVIERTFYPKSKKVWDDTICIGTFKNVPKKLRIEYESVKKAHAEEFANNFVEQVLA